MSGNRFGRMPSSSAYMDAFNTATQFGQAVTDANQTAQIEAIKQNLAKLGADFNLLSRAVEEQFLKIDQTISDDDTDSLSEQMAWFFFAS